MASLHSREISSKGQPNQQHLLKNSVMGVCEQEFNDTMLRKEGESIPFLFSSCMNPSFRTEDIFCLLYHLYFKHDLRFSFSKKFHALSLIICKGVVDQIKQMGDDLFSSFTETLR